MIGTFKSALEARDVPVGEDHLWADVEGEIVVKNEVLVVQAIHVEYHLNVDASHHSTVDRVHGMHRDYCPVARTIEGCVSVNTTLVYE